MFSIYKNRKKNLKKSQKNIDSNFKKQLINNYQLSGLGESRLTILVQSQYPRSIKVSIPHKYQYNSLITYIEDFISKDLLERSNQPITDMLREASIDLCIPHLLSNNQHNDKFSYENWNNKKNMIIDKIKSNRKLTIFEKIYTPFPYLIAYSIIRCQANHKLIIIPISVNVNLDHANLLIIDLRYPEKSFTSTESTHYFITYLFEPNGTKYSYQYHNVDKISNYINQTNLILQNLGINFQLKSLEVIGGDYGGLQTSLGEESVDFFGRYKKKQGYPICGAIGYWVIYFWLYNHSYLSLPQFVDQLIDKIQKSEDYRDELKNEVFDFVEDMKLYQEENFKFKTSTVFFKNLHLFLKEDVFITQFINEEDYHNLIEIKFNIQLSYHNPKFNNKLIFKILFKHNTFYIFKE